MMTAKQMREKYYWHSCSTILKNAFETLAIYEIIDPVEYQEFEDATRYWYHNINENEICDHNEMCYIRHKETNEGITLIMVPYDRD